MLFNKQQQQVTVEQRATLSIKELDIPNILKFLDDNNGHGHDNITVRMLKLKINFESPKTSI